MKQIMSYTQPNEIKLWKKSEKWKRIWIFKMLAMHKLTGLNYKDCEKSKHIVDSLYHYWTIPLFKIRRSLYFKTVVWCDRIMASVIFLFLPRLTISMLVSVVPVFYCSQTILYRSMAVTSVCYICQYSPPSNNLSREW